MRHCPDCSRSFDDAVEHCPHDGTLLISDDPLLGAVVDGKFRVEGFIGRGAMGAVYNATQLALDRPVALKVMLGGFLERPETLERFRREAMSVARLRHPNVITVFDFGVATGAGAYLAMELLDGRSLRAEIDLAGRLDPETAVEWIRQACAGVQAAHRAGIVHRDLKPDNVFVDRASGHPVVKVLDFGVAKLKDGLSIDSARLTGTGVTLGTPLYMSPEQCHGLATDERSDVYALGCVLYEMLTGRPPFAAHSVLAVLNMHVTTEPLPLTRFVPGIAPALEAAVLRALAKAPGARFQSAEELARALAGGASSSAPAAATLAETFSLETPPKTATTRAAGLGGTVAATPNNLPQPVTSFVGRARELEQLGRMLAGSRLVTLVGPGGIGKTRVALEAASRSLARFPGGVWFADLAQVADAAFVPKAVAAAAGVAEQPGRSIAESIADALRGRASLVVLDGCEHVVAGCAQLAGALLRACHDVSVLATSRETLGVAGEAVVRVGPLAAPEPDARASQIALEPRDAVGLFVARARLADSAFELTPENAGDIATLCRRLDGIPLAIELAAARVRVLGVAQMLERLDDRFRLLTGGDRSALPRQQTLRATMDWSYGLLAEPERLLLARLAVFAGGWRLEAAEEVCAGRGLDEAAVLDALGKLVDKSLVLAEPLGPYIRYRLLESVREYGLERLRESGEEERLRALHRGWALRLAEAAEPELERPVREAWLARLDAEVENFRAALQWSQEVSGDLEATFRLCNALAHFWIARGHASEAAAWYRRTLPRVDAVSPELRAETLLWAGTAGFRHGDYPAARELLERALAEWRALGDRQKTAQALRKLGIVSEWLADYDASLYYCAESIALSREIGDWAGVCHTLGNLAVTEIGQGRYDLATRHLEESLAIARSLEMPSAAVSALHNLGEAALRQGDLDRARELFEESLALCTAQDLRWNGALNVNLLGTVALEQGELDRAAEHFASSLEYARGADDHALVAYGLAGFASVAAAEGDAERAARLAGAARQLRDKGGWKLWPAEQDALDRQLAPARSALGERWNAVERQGRELELDEAVALALERAPRE